MVTKTFCDHCGNVARDVTVLSFGGVKQSYLYDMQKAQAMQMAIHAQQNAIGGLYGGAQQHGVATQNYPQMQSSVKPAIEVIDVDLCPHCVNIWMNRVKAITKASDPE